MAIARACVKKSKIIIADEPTASLDEERSNKVMELFKWINKSGKTIVLSSHDRDSFFNRMERNKCQIVKL